MARFIGTKDPEPIIAAMRDWVDHGLVEDGSIFSDSVLWAAEHLDELDQYFVNQPDAGKGSFYEKLSGQLESASEPARALMAEALWVLFLFPSNINAETKRGGVRQVWSWSASDLASDHPQLADTALAGIGSCGMGVNTGRWRELCYIIGLARRAKQAPTTERVDHFQSYDSFIDWIDTVPMEGNRQFPHMLRYLLFPDRVERMSSNRDRRKVLEAFGRGTKKDLKQFSSRELDDALFVLRKELASEHQSDRLDFYLPPLRDQWKESTEADEPALEIDESEEDDNIVQDAPIEQRVSSRVVNRIYYGPPGTGKTYQIQQLRADYTDLPVDVDRRSWERQLVSEYGWRAVIGAAMADLGGSTRVMQLIDHRLIQAKTVERQRVSGINQTLWGYLQSHADPSMATVNTKNRREPFLFVKNEASEWSLVNAWRDLDPPVAELLDTWREGPGRGSKPIERYRMVTFHPSYSYEDFVIGLRPVQDDSDSDAGSASFRLVPGVFAQICAVAKADPSRRYALFIDEINRADIAKVFGELITLIEPDKRARYDTNGRFIEGIEVQLPGTSSEEPRFGVPSNLDIYGTMNTADRSIALLDIALRRRFQFEELAPDYDTIDRQPNGIHLGRLLQTINERLEYLLDRDHRIGHAYLIHVRSLDDLRSTFANQIIPLLQEYFFDDWSRVALVLSSSRGRSAFVSESRLDARVLFGGPLPGEAETSRTTYVVTPPESWDADTFRSLYVSAETSGVDSTL